MELLVVSDSHGRRDRLRDIMAAHRQVRSVLFLGDGLRDAVAVAEELGMPLDAVRGNCDCFGVWNGVSYPEEQILTFGAYTVLMLHGHTRFVKAGTEQAIRRAAAVGADLLLYGHTHLREERYLPAGTSVGADILSRPLWVMNPGSVGRSPDGAASYGLVGIRGNDVLLSFGTL